MMNNYKYALFILLSVCSLLPISAAASGLGEISAISPLGDRFRAEIPLLNPSPSITAACFRLTKDSPDAMDDIPWLTDAQIAVLSSPPRLVISTSRKVVDPVIQLAIHSSCDASLTRHYTALLSPPAERNTELPAIDHLPRDIQRPSARERPDIAVKETPQVTRNKLGRAAQAGETTRDMARRKYPSNRLAQQRFIRQMVALNPEWLSSESGEETLPEGVELRYPTPSVPQAKTARQATQAKPAKRKPETPAGARDRLVLMPYDPPPEPPAALATPGKIDKQLSDVELQINTMRTELNKLRAEYTAPSPAIQMVLLEMESRLLAVELNAARITLNNLQAERPAIAAAPAPTVPAVPDNAANSEKSAVQPPQPTPTAPPAPLADKPIPWTAKLLTTNSGLLVLLGLFAVGLSAILYRRTGRIRKEFLATSTQVSSAPDTVQEINPIPAKVTEPPPPPPLPVPPPAPAAVLAAVEPPMASNVVENPMEIDNAIELADIFLTYKRTQDALDVLLTCIQENPKESLRLNLRLLEIYKQTNMRPEFELLAEQLERSLKVKPILWDETPSLSNAKPVNTANLG